MGQCLFQHAHFFLLSPFKLLAFVFVFFVGWHLLSLRMGDAITFEERGWGAEPNFDYCVAGLIMPPFNVKPLIEPRMKMLPYLVNRFDKDKKDVKTSVNIETLKLSAIYQFAREMPQSFLPAPSKKRKSAMLST